MACMNLVRIILQARNQHSIVFLLAFALLFVSSSFAPFHFMAQGRQLPNAHLRKDEEEMGVKMRSLIGSRPPRCEQRCRNCGKCEAVQVPIAPAAAKGIKILKQEIYGVGVPTNRVEYSRGDDITSYKPMCWKCRCGDFFFNP